MESNSNNGAHKKSREIIVEFVDMIKDGRLQVGDRLPSERALTAQLGVSRASLREALSALEIIGVIEVRHGEGSFVSELNLSPFLSTISPLFVRSDQMEKDLLDFRRLLELEALRLLLEKPDRNIRNLHVQLGVMREALDRGDVALNMQADVAFHREFFVLSENYILIQAADCVQHLMAKSVHFNVSKILSRGDNGHVLYAQHQEICQAIEHGFREKAIKLLNIHLDFVKNV